MRLHYTGRLEASGRVFGSSRGGKKPLSFRVGLGAVIRGWDEGLLGVSIGERASLRVPSDLAYGAKGVPGTIPPHAVLVFDVELLAVSYPRATTPATDKKARPNDPCECGSGKKSKKCCSGARLVASAASPAERTLAAVSASSAAGHVASAAGHVAPTAAEQPKAVAATAATRTPAGRPHAAATARVPTASASAVDGSKAAATPMADGSEEAGYAEAVRAAREAEAKRVADKKRARQQGCSFGGDAAIGGAEKAKGKSSDGGGGSGGGEGSHGAEEEEQRRKALQEAVRSAKRAERDAAKEVEAARKRSAVYRHKGSDRKRRKGGA